MSGSMNGELRVRVRQDNFEPLCPRARYTPLDPRASKFSALRIRSELRYRAPETVKRIDIQRLHSVTFAPALITGYYRARTRYRSRSPL